jgi:hypothetical protein
VNSNSVNVITANDVLVYVFEGREVDGQPATYAILKRRVELMQHRGQTVKITHLAKIVEPALPTCMVMFQGLNRPCKADEDMDGDQKKRILVLNATHDYHWPGIRRFEGIDGIEELATPVGKVYFAIVSPNSKKNLFPQVDYWLEHWGWVEADPSDASLPIDYAKRYATRLS